MNGVAQAQQKGHMHGIVKYKSGIHRNMKLFAYIFPGMRIHSPAVSSMLAQQHKESTGMQKPSSLRKAKAAARYTQQTQTSV
ncbi:MAG: hypothetical protein M3Z08_24260, partial [Chloroflexota bacterium]|nr:hypothetical protein [Chloroflexota bacterium]